VKRKGEARTVDLRTWIIGACTEATDLLVTLRHTEKGAGRIDAVLAWLKEAVPAWACREAVKVEMDMAQA
jgi:hypothetical protein